MSKTKVGMFQNGTFVANDGDGKLRRATDNEVATYLASMFPEEKRGAKIAGVRYDKENNRALAKYSDDKVYQKKVAQNYQLQESEPTDSGERAKPDPEVPRDKSKSKPETTVIVKDRPDVGKPAEVRDGNFGRGPEGKDLHTDNVPRDSGGDGVGGKSVDFDKEVGDKSKSENPDTYVQDFTPSEKPAPAGTADNHTASTEVQFKSESEMYQPLGIKKAGEEGDEDKKKEDPEKKENEEKNEKSEGKKGKQPPWLKKDKGKDADEDNEKKEKEAQLKDNLKEANKVISELKEENNHYKIREARQKAANKYVLALLTLRPDKYADPETFNKTVDESVKKMNLEALETAAEEVEFIKTERQASQKQASNEGKTTESAVIDGGLSTAFVIERQDDNDRGNMIARVLQAETRLGREVAKIEEWEKEKYNE